MKTAITEMFGIEHPIIQGGMMWVSQPELVAAVSNAGGLGILTALTFETAEGLTDAIALGWISADASTLVSGIVLGASMFGGSVGAALSVRLYERLGILRLLYGAFAIQLAIVGGLVLVLAFALAVLAGLLVELTLGDAAEALALVLADTLDHPLVHRVGHEQDVLAAGAHRLKVGATRELVRVLAGDIPDGLLALRHGLDVLAEAL